MTLAFLVQNALLGWFSGSLSAKVLTQCIIFHVVIVKYVDSLEGTRYSRPQRLRSFWSAPRIATSGQTSGRFAFSANQILSQVRESRFRCWTLKVLGLLGQRWVAGENSGDTKKYDVFNWLSVKQSLGGSRSNLVPRLSLLCLPLSL